MTPADAIPAAQWQKTDKLTESASPAKLILGNFTRFGSLSSSFQAKLAITMPIETPTTNPNMPNEQQLSKNYDRAAWFYEISAYLFSTGKIRQSKKYTVASMQPGEKVVFLGVGSGEEVVAAARKGVVVTCIDISQRMLHKLERRLAQENLQVELICQDAFEHDRIGYYDACVTNYFLNVFLESDMQRMMQHAASLVRPDGKFMIADVALPQGNILSRAFNWCYLKSAMAVFWMLGLVPWHKNYDYESYFASAGLATDHVRYFRFLSKGPVLFQTIVATKKAQQAVKAA